LRDWEFRIGLSFGDGGFVSMRRKGAERAFSEVGFVGVNAVSPATAATRSGPNFLHFNPSSKTISRLDPRKF
jgi:hypothetical protein